MKNYDFYNIVIWAICKLNKFIFCKKDKFKFIINYKNGSSTSQTRLPSCKSQKFISSGKIQISTLLQI